MLINILSSSKSSMNYKSHIISTYKITISKRAFGKYTYSILYI